MIRLLATILTAFVAMGLYNINLDVLELHRTIIHALCIAVLVFLALSKKCKKDDTRT